MINIYLWIIYHMYTYKSKELKTSPPMWADCFPITIWESGRVPPLFALPSCSSPLFLCGFVCLLVAVFSCYPNHGWTRSCKNFTWASLILCLFLHFPWFLAMQEEALKLVLLALEDGSALSRKVLVLFVVQRLEPRFPQASKTSIGHVVQLLYRASCFKVWRRFHLEILLMLRKPLVFTFNFHCPITLNVRKNTCS